MQPRQVATVRVLDLGTFGRIEQAGHLRAVQNLELGHFRRVKTTRLGNRGFLLVGRRPFRDPAISIFPTHPLHGQFHGGFGLVLGGHGVSVARLQPRGEPVDTARPILYLFTDSSVNSRARQLAVYDALVRLGGHCF